MLVGFLGKGDEELGTLFVLIPLINIMLCLNFTLFLKVPQNA